MDKHVFVQSLNMYKRLIYDISVYKIKLAAEMEQITIKALVFGGLYHLLYIFGIIVTIEDIKHWILIAFLVITGSIRFYRWLIRDDQNRRLKEIDIRDREISQREKLVELEERELNIQSMKKAK